MNRFAPLSKASNFKSVELLVDGSCKFERQYFFRTVKAKLNKNLEFEDFNVSLNVAIVACVVVLSIVIFSFGAIIPLFAIWAIGMNTRENLLSEVTRLIS